MSLVERMQLPPEELKVIADLTVRLTELRLREHKQLQIEDFAPDLWAKLLAATYPPPLVCIEPGAMNILREG